jgi:hypothetical protein
MAMPATLAGLEEVLLHRWLLGAERGQTVDHVNWNRLDCRRQNLRFASGSEQNANQGNSVRNTTGYRGVARLKGSAKFRSLIRKGGVQHFLGYFDDARDAARAYNEMAVKIYGPFAWINDI